MKENKKETSPKTSIEVLDKGIDLTRGNAEAECCTRSLVKLSVTVGD